MRRLIWRAADDLTHILRQRGLSYAELNSALVPQIKKSEIALLFDRASVESAAYGWQIHARVLPLLNPTSNHSILHGDLNDEAAPDNWIGTALQIHLQPSGNPFRLVGGNQIFCVYLNNVSPHLRRTLHDTLKDYRPYIGYADTTYASQFKAYLSQTLVPAYLKHGRIILLRRAFDPGADLWTFPGGFVDLGESVEDAARREAREELEIDIELDGLVGVYSRADERVVLVVFSAVADGNPTTTEEATEVRAYAPDELPWGELAFWSTELALRDALARG